MLYLGSAGGLRCRRRKRGLGWRGRGLGCAVNRRAVCAVNWIVGCELGGGLLQKGQFIRTEGRGMLFLQNAGGEGWEVRAWGLGLEAWGLALGKPFVGGDVEFRDAPFLDGEVMGFGGGAVGAEGGQIDLQAEDLRDG